jgi:RsiW-degrading membrane proteinase PrsW (M82 family)
MVIFAILLGVLPSLIWLIFFLKEDLHPEPKGILARIFIYGSFAALMAVVFQYFFQDILNFFKIGEYAFISFFIFAAVEEILKFTIVYITVNKKDFFDEPVDAMIYMITAALGFAALENIFIASNGLIFGDFKNGELFSILTIRFVGATLFHALGSAIVGYYWAKGFLKIENFKLKIIQGLIIATFLHAVFNYSIIIFKDADILIYPLIFLIIIALVVFKDFERVK